VEDENDFLLIFLGEKISCFGNALCGIGTCSSSKSGL
jgi:hypothetical protein